MLQSSYDDGCIDVKFMHLLLHETIDIIIRDSRAVGNKIAFEIVCKYDAYVSTLSQQQSKVIKLANFIFCNSCTS